MSKFKIFAFWIILIEIVLVVLGNGLYLYESSGNSGRLYLVEVSRLVKEIEEQKLTSSQVENINLNKYKTLVDIGEFLAGESCKHDYLVEEINMALKGILSKSKLEEKEFIVPPMELQKRFADFVAQVDKSKVAVQKALDETQLLFDSLMQQYFD